MAERNTLPLSNCSQFSIIVCDPFIIIYIVLQIINENDDSKSEIELLQMKAVTSELESDMSQSQASSEQSPKATNSSSNSDEESSDPSVNSGCSFEEVSVGSETFCLVPKPLMKYVPTATIDFEYLEGIGSVEVGNEYLYISRNLLIEMKVAIDHSTDLQKEVKLCREFLWSQYGSGEQLPPFEPSTVKQICLSTGANKLFQTIFHAMSSDDHSANRQILNEKKTVAVIYMLIFGQSQKASWFQKLISSAVVSKGISEGGLSILHQSGIATSKSTQRREMYKSSKSHDNLVREFITDATEKRAMLVFMVDDFTTVHTKRRPTNQKTSTASNMATLLLKRFHDGSAIPVSSNIINPNGIATSALTEFLDKSVPSLSATFASLMPHWVRSAFFDPEAERTRVDIHNYQAQQMDITAMRKMSACRLLDSIEVPLKGFENFLKAACHAKDHGLGSYLEQFVCPQPGDWPAQFYMRQVQNHASKSKSLHPLSNIIPFLGPLHIQLNARECVCLLNISFFKRVYKFIFGPNKILANKPKPWRVSLILEVLYGRLDRNSNGGGLLVYVKEDIPSKQLKSFKFKDDIECIGFEVNLRKKKWAFFSIYRPPSQAQPYFFGQLNTAIDHYSDKYENFVVVGDFNALETEQDINDFMDLFALKNLVKEPTCFKTGNPRCIDLILTNRERNFQHTTAIETGLSDFHKLIVTVLKTTFDMHRPNVVNYRDYRNFREDIFRLDIQTELADLNVQGLTYTSFQDTFQRVLDKHAPMKKR